MDKNKLNSKPASKAQIPINLNSNPNLKDNPNKLTSKTNVFQSKKLPLLNVRQIISKNNFNVKPDIPIVNNPLTIDLNYANIPSENKLNNNILIISKEKKNNSQENQEKKENIFNLPTEKNLSQILLTENNNILKNNTSSDNFQENFSQTKKVNYTNLQSIEKPNNSSSKKIKNVQFLENDITVTHSKGNNIEYPTFQKSPYINLNSPYYSNSKINNDTNNINNIKINLDNIIIPENNLTKNLLIENKKILDENPQEKSTEKSPLLQNNPIKRKFTEIAMEKNRIISELTPFYIRLDLIYNNFKLENCITEKICLDLKKLLEDLKTINFDNYIPTSNAYNTDIFFEYSIFWILYIESITFLESTKNKKDIQLDIIIEIFNKLVEYEQNDINLIYKFYNNFLRRVYKEDKLLAYLKLKNSNYNLKDLKFLIDKPEYFLEPELNRSATKLVRNNNNVFSSKKQPKLSSNKKDNKIFSNPLGKKENLTNKKDVENYNKNNFNNLSFTEEKKKNIFSENFLNEEINHNENHEILTNENNFQEKIILSEKKYEKIEKDKITQIKISQIFPITRTTNSKVKNIETKNENIINHLKPSNEQDSQAILFIDCISNKKEALESNEINHEEDKKFVKRLIFLSSKNRSKFDYGFTNNFNIMNNPVSQENINEEDELSAKFKNENVNIQQEEKDNFFINDPMQMKLEDCLNKIVENFSKNKNFELKKINPHKSTKKLEIQDNIILSESINKKDFTKLKNNEEENINIISSIEDKDNREIYQEPEPMDIIPEYIENIHQKHEPMEIIPDFIKEIKIPIQLNINESKKILIDEDNISEMKEKVININSQKSPLKNNNDENINLIKSTSQNNKEEKKENVLEKVKTHNHINNNNIIVNILENDLIESEEKNKKVIESKINLKKGKKGKKENLNNLNNDENNFPVTKPQEVKMDIDEDRNEIKQIDIEEKMQISDNDTLSDEISTKKNNRKSRNKKNKNKEINIINLISDEESEKNISETKLKKRYRRKTKEKQEQNNNSNSEDKKEKISPANNYLNRIKRQIDIDMKISNDEKSKEKSEEKTEDKSKGKKKEKKIKKNLKIKSKNFQSEQKIEENLNKTDTEEDEVEKNTENYKKKTNQKKSRKKSNTKNTKISDEEKSLEKKSDNSEKITSKKKEPEPVPINNMNDNAIVKNSRKSTNKKKSEKNKEKILSENSVNEEEDIITNIIPIKKKNNNTKKLIIEELEENTNIKTILKNESTHRISVNSKRVKFVDKKVREESSNSSSSVSSEKKKKNYKKRRSSSYSSKESDDKQSFIPRSKNNISKTNKRSGKSLKSKSNKRK